MIPTNPDSPYWRMPPELRDIVKISAEGAKGAPWIVAYNTVDNFHSMLQSSVDSAAEAGVEDVAERNRILADGNRFLLGAQEYEGDEQDNDDLQISHAQERHRSRPSVLFITGRKKEMIIVGGENVFPGEIEAILTSHPAVAEAAVIGVAHGTRGEVPVAFVTLTDDADIESPDEQGLRAFARRHLAGYKVPREIRIADDLPRGPTGKILKRKLAALL